ncbi:MAG: bifunctional demethylmenaquinone methyltransferase/2-methoxy-6-polyprenyl-1,4-benzoquinol methylase UbiE [candidate division Zixibacteria bacterium]|nr:bifunctional demethylmenaquinone methyltransferase/2-methoxy-6-polyprenyl-1,4-benzoquinol methylase UbiE [candidate division Zixibacteria bacterium]
MFDRIAHRYDLLNHLLSGNRDKQWRRKVADTIEGNNLHLLDLATGTGDQLLAAYDSGKVVRGMGIDPAEQMLMIGRKKIEERNLTEKLSLMLSSAEKLPFQDNSFDTLTMSFGIRNVMDITTSLSEMRRVLKADGQIIILEFSLPPNRLMRALYLFYFRQILPRLGGLISGDSGAYRYLNQTVESFPYGEQFCTILSDSGFKQTSAHPLTFGIATMYTGRK